MDRDKKIRLIVRAALFAIFIFILVYITINFVPELTKIMKGPQKFVRFREFINSQGASGALMYIMLQIMHVIIVVIPGEFVQIGGGYIFGTFLATVYMTVGTIVGELIVFFMSRMLGHEIINDFVPKDKLEKFNNLLNNPKSDITMFVLFLIPGIPKDALVYAAGFTPIKPMKFIVISLIARFPGLLGSAYIGSNLHSENYKAVIIMSVAVTILFVIGLITKDKIIHFIHERTSKDKGDMAE